MLVFRNLFRYQKQIFQQPKRSSKHELELNLQKQKARLMQEKLTQQTSNIENNTPRIMSILFGAFTIPSFYYFYQVLQLSYEDINMFYNLRYCVDWVNFKQALNCGLLVGLNMIRYSDFKAKNALRSKVSFNYAFYTIPLLFGLLSHSCIDSLSEWWVVPTLGNLIATMIAYSHATNFGTAPFWTFALTYQVFALDLVVTGCLLFAMKNLKKHREKHVEQYAKY